MIDSNCSNKQPKIFPKLFIGQAAKAFVSFINKNNYNYNINYIQSREDLISLIDTYSQYKNYNLPVIISDISYLNKADQSLLLKFMEDSNLKIILLASRDNILNTIISRVKEFRKYYVNNRDISFMNIANAYDNSKEELELLRDSSIEDKCVVYNKYNPVLYYINTLVNKRSTGDREKLLNLLEFNNE